MMHGQEIEQGDTGPDKNCGNAHKMSFILISFLNGKVLVLAFSRQRSLPLDRVSFETISFLVTRTFAVLCGRVTGLDFF
jgi:hypothetical protein